MFTIRKSKKIGKHLRVNYSSKSGVGLSGGVGPVRFNTKQKRKSKKENEETSIGDTLAGFAIVFVILALIYIFVF